MRYRLTVLVFSVLCAVTFPFATHAATIDTPFIKGTTEPTVFYYSGDAKFQFPDWETYRSWAIDQSGLDPGIRIRTFDDASVKAIPFGGYVTYPPGRFMKTASDPKVYLVAAPRTLRWIPSEDLAAAILKTPRWSTLVATIDDARIADYTIADPIQSAAEANDVIARFVSPSIRQSVPTPSIEKFPHPQISAVNDAALHSYVIHTPLTEEATLAWARTQNVGWTLLSESDVLDQSSLNHLFPEAYAGQSSVGMRALTYGISKGSTFAHKVFMIPSTFRDVPNETILSFFETTYPEGYLVYPRAVTTQFEGTMPVFGQELITQSSTNDILKWYTDHAFGYGWIITEMRTNPYVYQNKTYTNATIELQRANPVWRMQVDVYDSGINRIISVYTR